MAVASSYDFQQSMILSSVVTNLEHMSTPNESVPATIKDAFLGFPRHFIKKGPVALVFGPDKGKIKVKPSRPIAHYTIFGWVLSGVCH